MVGELRVESARALNRAQGSNSEAVPGQNITAQDIDSLHVLPLSTIPLTAKGIQNARIIKSGDLTSMIELFSGAGSGTGLIAPEQLLTCFDFPGGRRSSDYRRLIMLTKLPSYDVFSLRLKLRQNGVNVDEASALQLSQEAKQQLATYMNIFTRPLLRRVYGGHDQTFESVTDLVRLLADPKGGDARKNLRALAGELGLSVFDLPNFLNTYADLFLSVAYYRRCLDNIEGAFKVLHRELRDLGAQAEDTADLRFADSCRRANTHLKAAFLGIKMTLDTFQTQTENMWSQVSQDKFQQIEEGITSRHEELGAALCALTVKIHAFERQKVCTTQSYRNRQEVLTRDILPRIDTIPILLRKRNGP